VWVVTDSRVLALYGRRLHRALAELGADTTLLDVPPGESSKTPALAGRLHTRLLHGGIERSDLVVALGGGVVGDIAGYVAATVLRGVEWVQAPTTLLAQVDSSVGGKVGVDHPAGKNLIGAFHHPLAVFADTRALRTLPARELRAGMAEMVKIALALHAPLYGNLERILPGITPTTAERLAPLIRRCIGLKAAVVERDPREQNLRAVLNLGHTVGHAVEHASGYRLLHGEAVAIGLSLEARVAEQLGLLRPGERERLVGLLRRLGLPVRLPAGISPPVVLRRISADKKAHAGEIRFTLPCGIGSTALGVRVPDVVLRSALAFRP
jgi:3-dehydroquinate synthase